MNQHHCKNITEKMQSETAPADTKTRRFPGAPLSALLLSRAVSASPLMYTDLMMS